MALSTLTLCIRARRLFAHAAGIPLGQISLSIFEIAAPHALGQLAERIVDDRDRRSLLQQTYSVTVTGGSGNLLTATGAITSAADIIIRSVPLGYVKDSDDVPYHQVLHRAIFEGSLSTLIGYYLLDAQRIRIRARGSGSLTENLTLSVYANFYPTAATVPTELEDEAVQALADYVSANYQQLSQAQSAQELDKK
ncbi:MAG TPA: hypothetical protein VD948_13030 [Rhodothermales bacterium]|nr:hypothetical protein [Rhodothermales bacterium]